MAWPVPPLDIEVSLDLGADPFADPTTWVFDTVITAVAGQHGSFVRAASGIRIQRGRRNEQGVIGPASCTMVLDNRDGRFTRLNPLGAYYGQLRKNTPIRVRVRADPGDAYSTRFTGLVSEWPAGWNPRGTDFWVSVRADGILRLLGQGRTVASPLRAAVLAAGPVAYWPLEDGPGATKGSSALPGGAPIIASGGYRFGAEGMAGSTASVDLGDLGALSGEVPLSDTNEWRVEFVTNLGTDPFDTNSNVDIWSHQRNGTTVVWSPGHNASGSATLLCQTIVDGSATLELAETYAADLFAGADHHVALVVEANGTGADWTWLVDGATAGAGTLALGLAKPVPPVQRVTVSYQPGFLTPPTTAATYRFASLAFFDAALIASIDTASAAVGYDGELAGVRFTRLLAQAGLTADVAGTDTQAMGPQPAGELLALLRECETASQGVVVERRTGELGLDLVSSRYNQAVALTLDYAARHLSPDLEAQDDDLSTHNDVTARSTSTGHEARADDDDGPLGVASVGRYDEVVQVNVPDDDLANIASWRLNL